MLKNINKIHILFWPSVLKLIPERQCDTVETRVLRRRDRTNERVREKDSNCCFPKHRRGGLYLLVF